MKTLTMSTALLLCAAVISPEAFAGYNKTEHSGKSDMKGKVKSMRQVYYRVEDKADYRTTKTDTLIETYDRNGNITWYYYNAVNLVVDNKTGKVNTLNHKVSTKFTYNDKKQLATETTYHTVPWPDTTMEIYSYDMNGRKTGYISSHKGKQKYKSTLEYDDKGRVIKEVTTRIEKNSMDLTDRSGTTIYTYKDDNGKMKKSVYEISDNDTVLLRIESFDKQGNEVMSETFSSGELSGTREYRFDNEGRLTSKETIWPVDENVNSNDNLSFSYSNFDKKGNYLLKKNSAGDEMVRVVEYYE